MNIKYSVIANGEKSNNANKNQQIETNNRILHPGNHEFKNNRCLILVHR